MASVPAVIDRGHTARQEFGVTQTQSAAETAIAAVSAREQAKIQAMFIMAERHPRNWDTVRVRLLQHCERFGFAEVARYQKPAGRKKVNGEWKETFAEGLSARFAEIARQEMCNTSTETSVIYEDDLIRIVRASVMDLERNSLDAREITIAKVVEKRGKQDRATGEWTPPEGREVISQRINSYGEPSYLVRATDDEVRAKQNSEISKAQRDESLRLIPKDIRDDCEARILATISDPKKIDPAAARKKLVDSFAALGVMPDDLVTYIGCALDRCSPPQITELRGLWTAIKDGEIDFTTALKAKYDQPGSRKEAEEVADQKIADMQSRRSTPQDAPAPKATPKETVVEVSSATQPRTKYDRDNLPDAAEVPAGTECEYEGKILRVIEEGGEVPAWKTVEEPIKETPRNKPVFGRK